MTQDSNSNQSKEIMTLEELVERARHTVKTGNYQEAYDLLYSLVRQAEDSGYPELSLLLIKTLDQLLNKYQLEPENRAWLLNSKGLALQSLGHMEESAQLFIEMQNIGKEINDKQVIATSLMNQGIQALHIGNARLAHKLFSQSLNLNHELGNYRQAIQIRLDITSLNIEAGDYVAAEKQMSIIQNVIEPWKEPHLLSTYYGQVGQINAKKGNYTDARYYFEKALKNARRSGDIEAEIITIQNLGTISLEEGDYLKAIRWYKRAATVAKNTQAIISKEPIHAGMAVAFHQLGRYKEAANSFKKARSIAKQIGNKHALARYSADLGAVLLLNLEHKAAKRNLREALAKFMDLGDRQWEYRVLRNLIEAYWRDNDRKKSMQTLKQALNTLSPKSYSEKAELFGRVGQLWLRDRKELKTASYYFKRQLFSLRKLNDLENLAWHSALAGAALSQFGGNTYAIYFFTRAVNLYKETKDNHMEFHVLNDRANAYSDLGRFNQAFSDYKTCMTLAEQYSDRVMRLQTLLNWGETSRRKAQLQEAETMLREAIKLSRNLEDRESEAEALANLGITLSDKQQWNKAEKTFRHARDLAHTVGSNSSEASAFGGLATIAFVKQNYKAAAKLYAKAAQLNSPIENTRQFMEDKAGLIESLAAAGKNQELEVEAQKFVDTAQELVETEFASEALMRTARWLLKRNKIDDAVGLYAAGIVISGLGPEKDMINRLSKACLMMAFHFQIDASDQGQLYNHVVDHLNSAYKGIGEVLRDIIELSRKYVIESEKLQR